MGWGSKCPSVSVEPFLSIWDPQHGSMWSGGRALATAARHWTHSLNNCGSQGCGDGEERRFDGQREERGEGIKPGTSKEARM